MPKLYMYRGDAASFDLAAKNRDGSPKDISSGVVWFTVKSHARQADVDAIAQYTSDTTGVTITDGPNGLFTVTFDKDDTASTYAPSYLVWDAQFVTAGGEPITLDTGTLVLEPDVTRST